MVRCHAQPAAVLEPPAVSDAPASTIPATVVPATVRPVPRDGKHWLKRHASMNKRVAQGNVDLLMIGDSITHAWEGAGKELWAEYYAKRNAVNLGISGDRTQHVLWRLQNGNIENITPKLAVIMIGTNNSKSNTSEEIALGVETIVELLRKELPEMKILVLAIFPRGETADDKKTIDQRRVEQNHRATGRRKKWFTISISKKAFLEEDGTLPKELMPDFLHPKKKGLRNLGTGDGAEDCRVARVRFCAAGFFVAVHGL